MSEERELNGPEREVAGALARLEPVAPRRDPAAVMFELGQQAERSRGRRWRAGAGAMSLLLMMSLGVHGLAWWSPPDAGTVVAEHVDPQASDEPTPRHHGAESEQVDRLADASAPSDHRFRTHRRAQRVDAHDRQLTLGYMTRLVQEHGIDALPEPRLRLAVEPINLADLDAPL